MQSLCNHEIMQAIMQSASATAPWGVITKEESLLRGLRFQQKYCQFVFIVVANLPKVDLTRLAELMDCPHERKNIRGAIECLRKANATDMVRYSSIIITNSFLRVIVISL